MSESNKDRTAGLWIRRGAVLGLALPVVIALPIFGAAGQLGTTHFPEEWKETREVLQQDHGDYNVLFLPWHMYFWNGWLPNDDKTLANPAPGFFGPNVISGDNIEYGPHSQSRDPVSDYVEYLISRGNEVNNLGELLVPLNVKYVILAHESNYDQYSYLDRQQDLEAVHHGQGMTLYLNRHPISPVYTASRVHRISGFDRLVEISREEDVLDSVFVLDTPDAASSVLSGGIGTGGEVPEVDKKGMTRYSVGPSEGQYAVLSVKYGTTMRHWRKDGEKPAVTNLGMSPVFLNDGSASTITFGRRTGMIIMEAVALLAAMLGLVYVAVPQARMQRLVQAVRALGARVIRR